MTDVRPPSPPDEGVRVLRPELDAPPPEPEVEEYPPDPEAEFDTQEISLAELRAAAAAAGVELDEVAVTHGEVIDLAGVERREAHVLESGAVEPEPDDIREPDGEAVELPAGESDGAVPTSAGPFGQAGAPIEVVDGIETEPAVEGIDPRIHERREAVTAAQLARRRRFALLGVAVASAIGILWLIVQSPLLSVEHVQVHGSTKETRLAVERVAAVKHGSALLFLDTGEIQRRVESLPWVSHASVSRDFPNGVTITVEERLPVAWVRRPVPAGSPAGTLGPVAVVDVTGRVLDDQPQPPAGLPEIVGLSTVPGRGRYLASRAPAGALASLPDALRAQTASLVLKHGQGVLELATAPGGPRPAAREVRLGRLEQVAQKGAAALAVLDQLTRDGDTVRYVDVRVPGAPATR